MPSVRLNKKDKESLLSKLQNGHDLESAGAALGLTEAQIEVAQGKYGNEIAAAFKTGTARLRARIMDTALTVDDSATLLKLLEKREKQASQADPITLVERVIVQMQSCPHCDNLLGNPILEDKEPSAETDDNLPPVFERVANADSLDDMAEKGQKRSYMVPGGI